MRHFTVFPALAAASAVTAQREESMDFTLPLHVTGLSIAAGSRAANGLKGAHDMADPEYVSLEEVQRVCKELGIGNWAANPPKTVSAKEAAVILKAMAVKGMDIPVETLRVGLEVELEHGTRFADANVTNNHPILTGKIVLAHLKETMDYYDRLDVAEIEGDLLKAAVAGKAEKLQTLYAKLLAAKGKLAQAEADTLKS